MLVAVRTHAFIHWKQARHCYALRMIAQMVEGHAPGGSASDYCQPRLADRGGYVGPDSQTWNACMQEDIKLQRESVEKIADVRKMFSLLTSVRDRMEKDKDPQGIKFLEEVTSHWNKIVLEGQEHATAYLKNVHEMQDKCDAWLGELDRELVGISSGYLASAAQEVGAQEKEQEHVEMRMKLAMDFTEAGKEGSAERKKFEEEVLADLASAGGVAPDRLKIRQISPGSVIVVADIYGSAGEGPTAVEVAKRLEAQVTDRTSALRAGKVTSSVQDIAVSELQLEEHEELKRLRAATASPMTNEALKELINDNAVQLAATIKEKDALTQEAAELKAQISKLEEAHAALCASGSNKDEAVKQAHDLLSSIKVELEGARNDKADFKARADEVASICAFERWQLLRVAHCG